jgi:hypothetical protein
MHTQNGREIWITKGHLAALGTATLAIALLAFFVGVQVGRSQTKLTAVTASDNLLPDPEREDALEALLREVEAAQAAVGRELGAGIAPVHIGTEPIGNGAGLGALAGQGILIGAHVRV